MEDEGPEAVWNGTLEGGGGLGSVPARVAGFDLLEYLIFFGMLGLSALIGVYQALCRKSTTVEEYMLGGKEMPLVPVAISLAASFVSGISLLGIPAETYVYGTQLYNICFSIAFCYPLMAYFYLPVIYQLQAKSLFEYLELRFDKTVRTLTSFVYILNVILIVPVVIYVPALAFSQVTGISLYILAPLICGICIFYTSLGGLKAVVWSDALQGGCVLVALTVVTCLGIKSVGGLRNMLEINAKGERLEIFNFDPDPTGRNTFWSVTIGSLPTWLMAFAANPSTAQRYVSLATYRQAKMSVLMMVIGIVILKSLCTLAGLVLFARYHDCDPLLTKEVERPGQLLPHYTMEVAKEFPGLAGCLLAGVVCTALSTMSTMLNTVAGAIYEDLLVGRLGKQTDRSANLTIQLLTVLLGVICTALVFLVSQLGTIMQVAVSLQGITNGVLVFSFTFGMFLPTTNAKGAKAGIVSGILAVAFLVIGASFYNLRGMIDIGEKVRTTQGCPTQGSNFTVVGDPGVGTKMYFNPEVPIIFRLSYLYYSWIGLTVGLLVGWGVSRLTGGQDPCGLDPRLVIPQLRWMCQPKKKTTYLRPDEGYELVMQNLKDINKARVSQGNLDPGLAGYVVVPEKDVDYTETNTNHNGYTKDVDVVCQKPLP